MGFMQRSTAFATGLVLLAAAAVGTGCGDDDDGSTTFGKNCGTFQACGGNPIGTWSLQDLCYDRGLQQVAIDQFGPDCADEVQSYAFHGSLTVTFEKSSFSSKSGAFWADESVSITQKCLDAIVRSTGSDQSIPVAQYCPQLEAKYNQGGIEANCGLAAGACSCDLTIQTTSDSHSESGAYSVMGNDLIFDVALLMGMDLAMGAGETNTDAGVNANPDAHPFCVQGDKLSLTLDIADGPNMTLVFARK
jgi:hypothetical protein